MTQTSVTSKIGKQDLRLWDGVNDTFTRRTSAGGSLTLEAFDYAGVDILYAYGSGSAFTKATVDLALSNIGTTNLVSIWFAPGTWVFDATADYSAYDNVIFVIPPGTLLEIANGTTLTINYLKAGKYQIFSGSGTVKFGKVQVPAVYPEWWAAVADGDGGTDSGPALLGAVNASINGQKISLTGSYYNANTTLPYGSTNYLQTVGPATIFYGGSGKLIEINAGTAPGYKKHEFSDLELKTSSGNTGNGIAVYYKDTSSCIFRNMKVTGFDVCFEGYTLNAHCESHRFENVTVQPANIGWNLTANHIQNTDFWTFDSGTKTISCPSALFVTEGFLTGADNKINILGTADNDGAYTIATIPGETSVTVLEALVDETTTGGTVSFYDTRSMKANVWEQCYVGIRTSFGGQPGAIGLYIGPGISIYQSKIDIVMHVRTDNSIGVYVNGRVPGVRGQIGFESEAADTTSSKGFFFGPSAEYCVFDILMHSVGMTAVRDVSYHADCLESAVGLIDAASNIGYIDRKVRASVGNTVERIMDENGDFLYQNKILSGGAIKHYYDRAHYPYFVDLNDGAICPVGLLPIPSRRTVTDPSDTTPSVGEGVGLLELDPTGTSEVNYTNFDDGVHHQTMTILCGNNYVTIKNDVAKIQLSGAADFAMTAKSTLTLILDNNDVWREVSRMVY